MKLGRLVFLVALAAALFALLRVFVFETISIASASMEPTLLVGTRAVLDKLTYRFRDPRRGDIVIFRSSVDEGREAGKRIIALPGDTLEIRAKKVVLNGRELSETHVRHSRVKERLKGDDLGPWLLPADCYVLLGDNRDESYDASVWKDSRTGRPAPCLPRANIRGIVRGFF